MEATATIVMYVLAAASAIVGIITWFIDSDRLSAPKKFLIFIIAIIVSLVCFFATGGEEAAKVDLSGCTAISDLDIFSGDDNGNDDLSEENYDTSVEEAGQAYYEQIHQALENGDVEEANEIFYNMPYDSSYYDKALSEIQLAERELVNNLLAEAEVLIESGNLAEADALLEQASYEYDDYYEIVALITKVRIKRTINEVDTYIQNDDYPGAISCIERDMYSVYYEDEIISKYNAVKSEYKAKVFAEAEKAYKANGYQAAVNVLNSAISVLPSDEDMWAQKDMYLAFAPTKVTELNILSKSGAIPGEYYDRFNNKYDYAVEFLGDSGWLEFFNGGEYTELTCTIAPSRSFSTTSSKMTVYFYADDEKIAEYAVGYKTEPFEVSVPIAGSRIVAIDVEGRVSDGFSVYYVLLADFYAHK